jgi:hypothetical protein
MTACILYRKLRLRDREPSVAKAMEEGGGRHVREVRHGSDEAGFGNGSVQGDEPTRAAHEEVERDDAGRLGDLRGVQDLRRAVH